MREIGSFLACAQLPNGDLRLQRIRLRSAGLGANQCHRLLHARVTCATTSAMRRIPLGNVRADAGVQRTVRAADQVEMPSGSVNQMSVLSMLDLLAISVERLLQNLRVLFFLHRLAHKRTAKMCHKGDL